MTKKEYDQAINEIAGQLMYGRGSGERGIGTVTGLQAGRIPSMEAVNQAIADARPDLKKQEQEYRGLEALTSLFHGIYLHAKSTAILANRLFSVLEQTKKTVAQRTREDYEQAFLKNTHLQEVVENEKQAIEAYKKFLATGYAELRVSPRVTLFAVDVQLLLNDLQTRQAERIQDPVIRKQKLETLDAELQGIFDKKGGAAFFPPGKLAEIGLRALVRKQIHQADAGYRMSMEQSLPHEDFAAKGNRFDVRLFLDGRQFTYQITTNPSAVEYKQETAVNVVLVDPSDIQPALVNRDKRTVRRLVESLIPAQERNQSLIESFQALRETVIEGKNPEELARERAKAAEAPPAPKEVERNLNRRVLERLGLFDPLITDPLEAIRQAKTRAKSVLGTPAEIRRIFSDRMTWEEFLRGHDPELDSVIRKRIQEQESREGTEKKKARQ